MATVAVAYLSAVFDILGQYSVSKTELVDASGIAMADVEDRDQRIGFKHYIALWQQLAKLTQDPLVGVKAGLNFHPGNLGELSMFLVSAPSLYEATKQLIRYEHLLQNGIETRIGFENGRGYVDFECLNVDDPDSVSVMIEKECAEALATALFILKDQADTLRDECEVYFKHACGGEVTDYEALLGVKVHFGKGCNRLWFPPDALSCEIPYVSEGMYKQVLKEFELQQDKSLPTQVAQFISKKLHAGVPEIREVSEAFGMSYRTFQRRLAEEGTNYKDLVVNIRQELAKDLLQNSDHSVTDIAFLVGFAESSTFHQAFKRWVGMSPGEFRKQG